MEVIENAVATVGNAANAVGALVSESLCLCPSRGPDKEQR
jgi:hypothetical protein